MRSISCHITPLVINSLRGGHTHKHMHTHIQTRTHTDIGTETILKTRFKKGVGIDLCSSSKKQGAQRDANKA